MRTYEDIKAQTVDVPYLKTVCPEYSEVGNCTAIAMSALLDQDFDVSVYALKEFTGKAPGEFGWEPYLRAFKLMGYQVEETMAYRAKTVTTLERDPLLKQGRYLVSVSGGRHAVALVDGKVIDWSEGRRHRIETIWKVERDV